MSSFRQETLNSCRIELGTRTPNMSVVEDSLALSPLLLFIHLGTQNSSACIQGGNFLLG